MYDVLIIGAGIMGASIGRELSKYKLKTIILEKENDVADGTSKANSAIIHAGYDAKEGTLMAKYNARGNEMYSKIADELDIPFKRIGSFVLAFSEEEKEHLNMLYERGLKNGVPQMEILNFEEIKKIEPNISDSVVAGLYAKTAGIIGPWEATIGMIENAMDNGVELVLNSEVIAIEKKDNFYKVKDSKGNTYESKVIINCAGVYTDKVHNFVYPCEYKIIPRRGQYFVMDKNEGKKVNTVIFQCPNKLGKGVLVTPTVHGNLLLGPDSQDILDKEDKATTTEQLEFIKERATKSVKNISLREVIRTFAGLRAESDTEDFVIKNTNNFIDVAGIKSPGLSAAPAIAEDVSKMVVEILENPLKKEDFNPFRKKQIRFMELSNENKKEIIKKDSSYGRIICRCENITEGEIIDSIHRNIGATTVDGVKRRCRPGMGRCQGGFCGPRIQEILAKELNKPLESIVLDGENSYILTGETKK